LANYIHMLGFCYQEIFQTISILAKNAKLFYVLGLRTDITNKNFEQKINVKLWAE